MINIQAQMKELFGNSCLAYCYAAYITGNISDVKYLTRIMMNGWLDGFIDDDGFVSKPVQYINSWAAKLIRDIVRHEIQSFKDLPKGQWVVEMKLTRDAKASHFVIASRSGIIFDPSGDSVTAQYGVPVSYRELIYA